MKHAELQAAFLSRLDNAEKPLTGDKVLAIAKKFLGDHPKEMNEFGQWFQVNQDYLLKRLNS